MFSFFIDILFPQNCAVCKEPKESLCLKCLSSFEYSNYNDGNIRALFEYRDPKVRQAIQYLKYKRCKTVGEILGNILFEHTKNWKEFSRKDFLVIPIPLSRKRLHERGFNQSEIIAKAFAEKDKNKFFLLSNNLIKNRETKHQAQIKNKNERRNNLKNSFAVLRPEKILGKNIILIDDVLTTGTTFLEAKKVLREAGAKKIICLAIAH